MLCRAGPPFQAVLSQKGVYSPVHTSIVLPQEAKTREFCSHIASNYLIVFSSTFFEIWRILSLSLGVGGIGPKRCGEAAVSHSLIVANDCNAPDPTCTRDHISIDLCVSLSVFLFAIVCKGNEG